MPEHTLQEVKTTLLVWDAEDFPPACTSKLVLWRSFEDSASPAAVSIPRLVEANADLFRKQYLTWVYELGETRIQGLRLVDHLELRSGLSYWWMTLFAEKCNFEKSPQINDAIRLMAFADWATGQPGSHLIFATSNYPLAKCMRSWCEKSGFSFELQRIVVQTDRISWTRYLYQSLPHPIRGLTWLLTYLFHRWPLRGVGLREWCQTEGRTTFISYFFNLVPEAAKEGRFESRYWAHLPEELQHEGCKTNWLHLYIKDTLLPNASKAADAIRQFNKTGSPVQNHVTLDAFLGLGVIFRALRDWLRIAHISKSLQQAASSSHGAMIDLWPLFEKDWHRSFSGQEALSNLLNYNLLEAALKLLPTQTVGIYLQENQAWEFALIHSWKALGHGRLIGTAHSTIRYWDLRYFFDPRNYKDTGRNGLPMPDQLAINGQASWDACLTGDYPEQDLVAVEALRYLHLAEARTPTNSSSSIPKKPFQVLVLGDYLPGNTQLQMRLLEKAAEALPAGAVIIAKPHPNCPIRSADYPNLRLKPTTDAMSKLLGECDVAYTSSLTSAAVDAYCAGVPVISVLDPRTLNLSPLRGRAGVFFVSTPEELGSILVSVATAPREERRQQDFMIIDSNLPRWRKLLLQPTEIK